MWRKLHDEELYDLYCSPYIVRVTTSGRMGWVGHVARMGERIYIYIFPHQNPVYIYILETQCIYTYIYWILVGKCEGKRQLGRTGVRWEDNIKTDHKEVGCGGVNWIDLAQVRGRWRALVNAVLNLRVP